MGIRPLMAPQSARLPQLRDFLRSCATLAGKPLPPDPTASKNVTLGAVGGMGSSGAVGDTALAGGALVGSTPQYVPILPKPPSTVLISSHPNVDITPSPSAGYVVAAGGGTSSLIANSV